MAPNFHNRMIGTPKNLPSLGSQSTLTRMSSLTEQSGDNSSLERILSSIDVSPDTFLQPSASLQAASLVAAKRILDPVIPEYSVFRELALRGLDVEQVWEQVRLVGEQVKNVLERHKDLNGDGKSGIINAANNHFGDGSSIEQDTDLGDQMSDMEEDGEDGDEDRDIIEDDESSEDENGINDDEFPTNPELDEESEADAESTTPSEPKPFKKDVHGLNDEFFSIDDFNRLTEQQDNPRSDDDNVDEIDYFADPDGQGEESEEENPDEIKYNDFYRLPPNSSTSLKRKRAHFEEPDQFSDDELDDEARTTRFQKDLFADANIPTDQSQSKLSTHAKRQAAIKAQIEQLEQENIADKQWMYIGEASAQDRPKNSLIELVEEIDVERSAKPIPIVTEERTRSLEDIIKQRIIDNNFDDVKRKLPPSLVQKSRAVEEDPDMQEPGAKSSRGLAEIYEQEHLRRIDPANNPTPLSVSTQKQHAEVDELWKTLSHQLDSLTSWRFIPAPEVVDEHVVTNIPAVDMEDARPEAEAGATMLAPQEVYRPEAKKGEVVVGGVPIARVEMSREEKARARKRDGKKRDKTKLPPVEGGNKDVVETLKKGGVKIISHGRGRERGDPSSRRGGRVASLA